MKSRLARSFGIFIMVILLSIALHSSTNSAQTKEQAEDVIQQASEKVLIILDLFADLDAEDDNIRELISQTDESLQLINQAKQLVKNSDYDLAIEKANQALAILEDIEAEIDEIKQSAEKLAWMVFSIVGVVAALGSIGFVYLFIKKIYPWYKNKQMEEYGQLEIIYGTEGGKV